MALTVRELCEIPYLRTRIHAGAAGAERTIAWAHSIEMPRPWEWLEDGDLLMTVGLGLPADPAAQVEYVESLDRVGVSGIAIGENMQAPPLTSAMLAAAERCALPVLLTAYEVPFVQLSRAVGAASHNREHRRLVDAARIYDRVRAHMARGAAPGALLEVLGDELDCRLWVCTNESGMAVLAGAEVLPGPVQAAFAAAVQERAGALPGVLRLQVEGEVIAIVPVPARRPTSLLAAPRDTTPGEPPAYALLQHAATVAALEVERQWAGVEELRRLGSETLASLLDGRLSSLLGARQADAHGLGQGPYELIAIAREEPWSGSGWLHHALADRNVANMLLRRDEALLCLLRESDAAVDLVVELLGSGHTVGVSDPFAELDGVRAAAREARWALEAATRERPVAHYGRAQLSRFGARSVAEAHAIVERVLGPLLAYDGEHGTELVASLETFLACNRSWQRASAQLYVHKQTLVYRMQRVEALTGRRLNDTSAVVELWLAIQALAMLRS